MILEKLRKKLNSPEGETIAETLVGLLIAALALVMLAGAITAASNMVRAGRKRVEDYYAANEAANGVVKMEGGTAGTITMTDTAGAITHLPYNVTYFKNNNFQNKPVVSYKMVP